ncbi:4'-phosphopantetheinyl transferase superfamily protein [Nonomuraea sp. NBC_00507]|uniref:4'-phosphopantetheinyl transferase family protein n=1 Tax=Nonomuraea sp. NBC_00507 TaxID=2976002 RepID=UPI002E18744F
MTCEVWWAELGEVRAWHEELLDPVERLRKGKYRAPADRHRFILGCAITRIMLGRRLGVPAADVPLRRDCPACARPHGKPRLPGDELHLSVSHSGRWVAVAISGVGPVGIDVERVAERSTALVEAALADVEAEALGRTADPVAGFIAYWTRKEAVLKATGDGLRVPMSHVIVSPPDQPARLLGFRGRPLLRVALTDLPRRDGHAAALAIIGVREMPRVAAGSAAPYLAGVTTA